MDITGKNWLKLTSRNFSRSNSFARDTSESYQGLPASSLSKAQSSFGLLANLVSSIAPSVALGKPNQNVFMAYNKIANIALRNWQRNFRPIVNNVFQQAITRLANKGVLDSSVASHVLASAQSNYLNNFANLGSVLERQAIEQSINYPITALGLLGRLEDIYGNLSRIAKSKATSERRSFSFGGSYNPAPAVGLLTGLMGL